MIRRRASPSSHGQRKSCFAIRARRAERGAGGNLRAPRRYSNPPVMIGRAILLCCAMGLAACSEQKAKQLAADQLIDPGSTQFRNVRSAGSGAASRVCGEINGKNRMGAYAGFTRFIVNPATEHVQMDRPNARPASVALAQLEQCRRPGYSGYVRDCSYDAERYAEASLAEMFQQDWQRYCDPGAPAPPP